MIYSTVGNTSVKVYYSLFYQAEFNALGSQKKTVVHLDNTLTDLGELKFGKWLLKRNAWTKQAYIASAWEKERSKLVAGFFFNSKHNCRSSQGFQQPRAFWEVHFQVHIKQVWKHKENRPKAEFIYTGLNLERLQCFCTSFSTV